MVEEETKKEEKDELKMELKPKQEIAVFGLGVVLNSLKEIVKQNKEVINIMRHIENKIEAGLSEEAENKLEKLKKRF